MTDGVLLGQGHKDFFNKNKDTTDNITQTTTKQFVSQAQKTQINTNTSEITSIKTDYFKKATDTANDVKMIIGTGKLQGIIDIIAARGLVSGCEFSDNLDGTATYSTGEAIIKSDSFAGSYGGRFYVTGATLSLANNVRNFIYIDFNGGSPVVKTTTSVSSILYVEDAILIDIVYRRNTTLSNIGWTRGYSCPATLDEQKEYEIAEGEGSTFLRHAKGCITSSVGTRNIAVSEGSFWWSRHNKITNAFNTSTVDVFTLWYGDASNGFTETTSQTQIDNSNYYDGAGGLASLTSGYYSVRWLYMSMSGDKIHVFLTDGNYDDDGDAVLETLPTDIPDELANFCMPIARIIAQQGSNTLNILSIFEGKLLGATATKHSQLQLPNEEEDTQHYDSTPTSGTTAFEITDIDFTNLSDSSSIKSNDTVEVYKISTGTSNNFDAKWASCENFLAYIKSDTIYLIDKNSLANISNGAVGITTPMAINNLCKAYLVSSSYIRIVSLSDYSYSDVSNTNGTVYDAKFGPDGNLYFVNSTGGYFVRDSAGAAVSSGTLTGLVNVPVAIAVDTTHLYILDAPIASAGSVSLRKYDLATFSLQSSLTLTAAATSSGEKLSSISVENSFVLVSYSNGDVSSASNQQIAIVLKSTMALQFTSAVVTPGYKGVFDDGFYVTATYYTYNKYIVPSLTQKAPRHLDFTGVKSSAYNNGAGVYSFDDFCRATEHSKDDTIHLTATQKTDLTDGGVTTLHSHVGAVGIDTAHNHINIIEVESIEDSTPGSPSSGEYYLFSATHGTYPNYVAYYNDSTWSYVAPTGSSKVYNKDTGYYMKYYSNQWQALIDLIVRGTTNDGVGTGDTDILTLDGVNYPQLVLGELWSIKVEINGFMDFETSNTMYSWGKWELNLIVSMGDGDTNPIGGARPAKIYGSSSEIVNVPYVNFTFDTPTIAVDDATGDLKITVGHTDTATTGKDILWTAKIKGIATTSNPYYEFTPS